jgi:hypothetical protein
MLVLAAIGLGTCVLYVCWVAWVPLLPTNLYEPLLDLGKITEYTWPSALRFVFLIVGLHVLYLLGYRLVRAGRGAAWLIFAFGGLFCFELVWSYPATAADVFGYVAHGRLLADHGANPLTVAPSAFPHDPIMPYLAFPDEPSQYGPLWVVLNAGIALAGHGDLLLEVVLYKALGALAHLAGAFLVLRVAGRLGADRRQALSTALLFLWNPLLLWEMVGNAHNDGLMLLGGLLAIWLLTVGEDRLVLAAVALGASVKLPIAAIAPVLLIVTWRRGRATAIEGALLAAAVVAVSYWPFWTGPATLTALGRTELFTASPASVLRLLLEPVFGQAVATQVARALVYGAFAVLLAVVLWRARRTTSPRAAADLVAATEAALLLVGITWFQAWYVVWPFGLMVVLASPARHRAAVLLALGGLLQYLVFIYLWVMGVVPDQPLAVQSAAYVALIAPLAVGGLIAQVRARWPSRTPRRPRLRRAQAVRVTSA